MGTYVEIDGKLYVTKEDYLNTIKYYENSLSAERKGAKEEIEELEEENKKLKGLLKEHITTYDVHFDELIEENKKLKEENEKLKNDLETVAGAYYDR